MTGAASLPAKVAGRLDRELKRLSRAVESRPSRGYDPNWTFSQVQARYADERARYRYFYWFYRTQLPAELSGHRRYFAEEGRGFGEDAFHAMWFKLFAEFRPRLCLEIGVYRGQSLSFFELLGRTLGIELEAWGITPLDESGDGVSDYAQLDYGADIQRNFASFGLGEPRIVHARSQDDQGRSFALSKPWDLIYVDGSHEYSDVRADVALARAASAPRGILALDDASAGTRYRPFSFAFAGHPGPSRVAASADDMAGFEAIGTCGHIRLFRRRQEGVDAPTDLRA